MPWVRNPSLGRVHGAASIRGWKLASSLLGWGAGRGVLLLGLACSRGAMRAAFAG